MRNLKDIPAGGENESIKTFSLKGLKENSSEKKSEIVEKCEKLLSYVDTRYENSSLSKNLKQLAEFRNHNRDILKLSIEEGIRRGVTEKELKLLAVAASIHDIAKGDNPPEGMEEIDNIMVVLHGELAAEEIAENEELQELTRNVIGEENFNEESIEIIQDAFRSHMGPNPGFMKNILDQVNEKLEKKGLKKIEHPRPKEGAIVSEILLAADMYSLANPGGVRKVLEIRSAVPFFREEDIKLSEEYANYGITLSVGEAALISALESGKSARDMFNKKEDRDFLQKAINESESQKFKYSSDEGNVIEVDPAIVKAKMVAYEEVKEQKEIREKISEAA